MFERQLVLEEIGKKGQDTLSKAEIAVIGTGAIGTWSSLLLGSIGIGKVTLIDRDIIDESNLYHQPLYKKENVGNPKASEAAKLLTELFPKTKWEGLDFELNSDTIKKIRADLILDCTDNFEARYLINEFCIKNKIPWVYSSALRTFGFTHAFMPAKACFKCIYTNSHPIETCETSGIYNPTASAIASMQVSEAVKVLIGEKTEPTLIRFDAMKQELDKITFKKNPKCSACAGKLEFLNKEPQKMLTFCGGDVYQIYTKSIGKRKTIGPVLLFPDGRALVKANSEKDAKAKLHKYIPS